MSMSSARPARPIDPDDELVQWFTEPELAQWPHGLTIDAVMRAAAARIRELEADLYRISERLELDQDRLADLQAQRDAFGSD
jgi:hypothetical protein